MTDALGKDKDKDKDKDNGNGNGGSRRRLSDFYIQNKMEIDYKDVDSLRRFVSPEGKILPSRRSGLISSNQRKVTKAIKQARAIGLMPFVNPDA